MTLTRWREAQKEEVLQLGLMFRSEIILYNLSDTKQTEGEESDALDPERGPQVHLGNPATEEYSFRLFPAGETKERLAPFPLPAPYDNRLKVDNAQTRNATATNNTTTNNTTTNNNNNQQLSENSAPALPPKKGRREN